MKLLYITNAITVVGGLERVLSIKASYFADILGYEVHIVSLNEAGIEPFYAFSPAIHFHSLEVGGSPIQYVKQMRAVVASINPDIISVCDDGLKGFTIPIWIGANAKIIYERHVSKEIVTQGKIPTIRQKIVFKLMNICSNLFNSFIVLTGDGKIEWKGKNVIVIPNPLSFYPTTVSPLDQKKIIAVGRVSVQKGYERLVEAWKLINKNYPDWTIDIYGTTNDSGRLKELIDIYELSSSVKINSPTNQILETYLSTAIYALPSRYEGFGMVLTEAMACGVPCVAFDCPCGPRDIIRTGEDGYLVKNGDVQAFADRLSELIENESLRQSMGEQARINVQRYNIESVAVQWSLLFENILK